MVDSWRCWSMDKVTFYPPKLLHPMSYCQHTRVNLLLTPWELHFLMASCGLKHTAWSLLPLPLRRWSTSYQLSHTDEGNTDAHTVHMCVCARARVGGDGYSGAIPSHPSPPFLAILLGNLLTFGSSITFRFFLYLLSLSTSIVRKTVHFQGRIGKVGGTEGGWFLSWIYEPFAEDTDFLTSRSSLEEQKSDASL